MCGRHGGPAPNHTGWNATLERLIVLRGGKTIQDPFDNPEEISDLNKNNLIKKISKKYNLSLIGDCAQSFGTDRPDAGLILF